MELMLERLVFHTTTEPKLSDLSNGEKISTRPLARRLAALELSPGVVIAIAVGGAVFTFVALSIAIVIILRVRQRHQFAMSRAAGRRHLSRCPGNHPIVSETSYAAPPRPRNVLRRGTNTPYAPNTGWRAISSRESLQYKPLLKGLSRALVTDGRQSMLKPPRGSWPLSTRHTTDNPMHPPHNEGSPLSAITERSHNNTAPSPDFGRIAELPAEKSPRITPEKNTPAATLELQDRSRSSVWPTTPLKPKPLFHDHDSTRSAERFSQFSATERYDSIASVVDPTASSAGLRGMQPNRPRTFSRSVSICSQRSGVAPDMPMPPLPMRTSTTTMHRHYRSNIENSPSRCSATSFETANSSILADRDSKSFSNIGTDLTSIDLASPPQSLRMSNQSRKPDLGAACWDPRAMTRFASPHKRQVTRGFDHNQLLKMSSQVREAQHNVGADDSNGLSMSIPDEPEFPVPRRTQSSASRMDRLSRELTAAYGDCILQTPTPQSRNSCVRRHSYLSSNPSRRSSYRTSVSDILEDPRSKRESTSALQDVSGNQISPTKSQWQRRPSSLPTSDELQLRPSALKGGSGSRVRHKRQNCVRISWLAPVVMGPNTFPPTAEEPEEIPETPTHKPRIPGLTLTQPHPLPRPPSRSTFDPQISPPSDYKSTGQTLTLPTSRPQSSTSSVVNYYHNPSPTRSRPDSEDDFFNAKSDLTPDDRSKHLSTTSSGGASSTWTLQGIPPQAMRSFPPPPKPTQAPRPHHPPNSTIIPPPLFQLPHPTTNPTTPPHRPRGPSTIRGPRSQPPRSPAMKHTSTNRPSPGGGGARSDLRKNVLALRRMNSEVRVLSVVGTKRYFQMGGSPSPSPSPLPLPLWMDRCRDGESPNFSILSFEEEEEEERGGASGVGELPPRKIPKVENGSKNENEGWGRSGRVVGSGGMRGFGDAQGSVSPMTPRKGLALKVTAGTPGSLYDRDGFYKGT